MRQKFEEEQLVKLAGHTDWKYNNRRAGTEGTVIDVYYSENTSSFVYEVDFGDTGLGLVHQDDLEACE
jgi:hypothetical protein